MGTSGISDDHDHDHDHDGDGDGRFVVPATPEKIRIARQVLALLTAEVSDRLGFVVMQLHEQTLRQLVGAVRLWGEDVGACIEGGRLYAAYALLPCGDRRPRVWLNADAVAELASVPLAVVPLVVAIASAVTAYSAATSAIG